MSSHVGRGGEVRRLGACLPILPFPISPFPAS